VAITGGKPAFFTAITVAFALLGLLLFGDSPGPFDSQAGVRWQLPGDARHGQIERVVDGDTVYIAGLGSSRLIGVDTPEVYGGDECYGPQASAYTARLLPPGTPVDYEIGQEPRDRYGRTLVYLWLRDGSSVNAILVANGYATTLTIPPNTRYEQPLADLERQARRYGLGLWSDADCAAHTG
jgi:micrococcal nuclease